MDAEKIIGAAKTIQKHQEAQEYLERMKRGPIQKNDVKFEVIFAPGETGHWAAQEMLQAYASLEVDRIIDAALKNCVNTIEIHKDTIRRELGIET